MGKLKKKQVTANGGDQHSGFGGESSPEVSGTDSPEEFSIIEYIENQFNPEWEGFSTKQETEPFDNPYYFIPSA
ncbi:hypothetical protein K9M59_00365 [Candidatus Gracilibacteria bacterium]|nr:hypothetical protein [Candidatus Gracilibacteria bacterium]